MRENDNKTVVQSTVTANQVEESSTERALGCFMPREPLLRPGTACALAEPVTDRLSISVSFERHPAVNHDLHSLQFTSGVQWSCRH